MIYSVIGWAIEVSFHAVTLGKVVNRGFLNGPLCPVYGTGVLMVLIVLYAVGNLFDINTKVDESHPFLLFIIGIIFATLIELIAGFLLDKLFHARWWDYSTRRFNLNGYICLEFSIIWGLAIAFVLRVIQPSFETFVNHIPVSVGTPALIIIYVTFAADIVLTVMSVLKFNKNLAMMNKTEKAILKLSDGMSEIIGETTIKAVKSIDEGRTVAATAIDASREEFNEKRTEMAEAYEAKKIEMAENYEARKNEMAESYETKKKELSDSYEHLKKQLMYSSLFGTGRLIAAFPNMKHHMYQNIIDGLK